MTRRIVIALIVAAPLALLAIRFVDLVGGPHFLQYAISPGSYVGLQMPAAGSISDNLSRFVWTAVFVNEVYYAVLAFLVIWLWGLVRHSECDGGGKSKGGAVTYKKEGS